MILNRQLMEGVLLPALSADGDGSKVKFVNFDTITFHILASVVTTGATVVIERSLDGTNWVEVSSSAISANGVTEVLVKGEAALYYRGSVESRTDGTYAIDFNAA